MAFTLACGCGLGVASCLGYPFPFSYSGLQRTCKSKKAKNDTAHAQYLKDQRKNGKGSLFAFFFVEVARTLQTAVAASSYVAIRASLAIGCNLDHPPACD